MNLSNSYEPTELVTPTGRSRVCFTEPTEPTEPTGIKITTRSAPGRMWMAPTRYVRFDPPITTMYANACPFANI